MDNGLTPTLYALKMDSIDSDDYKSFTQVVGALNLPSKTLEVNNSFDASAYKAILINNGIPKRKKASILVMCLFAYLIDNVSEEIIYSGLGSDAYYGLGRNFAIQCSLKGEKTPSVQSLIAFRTKTYAHYMEQYVAIQKYAISRGKVIIAPFLQQEVFDYFLNKTYNECNKPKHKSILISLYPSYFGMFKARKPSNMHCGNSDFKKIKI